MGLKCFILFLSLTACWAFNRHVGFARSRCLQCRGERQLRMAKSEDDPTRIAGNRKGFYVRPSSAIERGGGFFVPGLEGANIRVLSAVVLAGLVYVNVMGKHSPDLSVSISASIGGLMALLLGLQGVSALLPAKSSPSDEKTKVFSITQISNHISGELMVAKMKAIAQTVEGLSGVIVLDVRTAAIVAEMGSAEKTAASSSIPSGQHYQGSSADEFKWLPEKELATLYPTLRLQLAVDSHPNVLVYTHNAVDYAKTDVYTWLLTFNRGINEAYLDKNWLSRAISTL